MASSSTDILLGGTFLAAACKDGTRPYWDMVLKSIKRAVDNNDHRVIVSISRKLYANMGVPRGSINLKAMLAVGEAWEPVYQGPNAKWGERAKMWLLDEYYPLYNVRGPLFDFKTDVFLDSVAIDREGDFFYLLTASDTGFPMVQAIPNYLIKSPPTMRQGARTDILVKVPRHLTDSRKGDAPSGPVSRNLTAAQVYNGVAYNSYGRAFAYCVYEEMVENDARAAQNYKWVHEQYIIHVFDPEYYEQGRGFPCFAHAVRVFLSMLTSQEFEEMTHMIMSSISLEVHNETGTSPTDPTTTIGQKTLKENLDAATNGEVPEVIIEKLIGGVINYMKSNTGAKITTPTRSSPGPIWDAFQDRLIRIALTGDNMPVSIVWKGNEDNGTSNRVAIEKMQRKILDRQSLLSYPAKRKLLYGVVVAMNTGRLQKVKDWWQWGFSYPPEFIIDDGRIAKSNREDYVMGHQNLTGILARQGASLIPHLTQRAEEEAQRQIIAKRTTEKYAAEGVVVTPDMLGTVRTSSTVGGGATDNTKDPEDQQTKKDKKD